MLQSSPGFADVVLPYTPIGEPGASSIACTLQYDEDKVKVPMHLQTGAPKGIPASLLQACCLDGGETGKQGFWFLTWHQPPTLEEHV